jgi:CHASE3 domain sensor protein
MASPRVQLSRDELQEELERIGDEEHQRERQAIMDRQMRRRGHRAILITAILAAVSAAIMLTFR